MSGPTLCHSCSGAIGAIAYLLAVFSELSAGGQEPPSLQYRRVLVPQAELTSQIRNFLPLKREEFERRLAAADRAGGSPDNLAAVRIDSLRLTARLDRNQLRGTADLEIVAGGSEPALLSLELSLEPCNVAVSSAAWTSPPAAAVIGVDPEGALRCLVPQSGQLQFTWNLPPTNAAPDETVFVLRLPAALRRTLVITSPDDVEWMASGGTATSTASGQTERLWTITLTGQSEVRLIARTVSEQPRVSASLAVRENANFTVSPATVDLQSTWTIDSPTAAARSLELLADADLTITSIQLNGQRVAFSLPEPAANEASEPAQTTYRLELPGGNAGQSRTLEVTAVSDWPEENRAVLPRLAIAGGVLQEGRLLVAAPAWMRLQARPLSGCVLSAAIPASAGRTSDQFQFEVFDATRTIELTYDQSPPPLREASGAQFLFEPAQVRGIVTANLTTLEGERFILEASIPRHWVLDSVELDPPEALADRKLLPRGQNQQLLRLSLARPLTPSRPIKVTCRAHARRPATGAMLPDDFLALARFTDVREQRRLTAVDIEEPGTELTLTRTGGVTRVDPEQLSAADQELFSVPPRALVVLGIDADQVPAGKLTSALARYRADVVVRAEAQADRWTQTIVARCEPEDSPVNSVLVRIAPRPPAQVRWTVQGAEGDGLQVAELPLAEGESGESSAALYRLTLPRSRSGPFELIGEWTSPSLPGREISLAWLPESGQQTGVVEVYRRTGENLLLLPDELSALPATGPPMAAPSADSQSGDSFTSLLARYRYDASRNARLRVQPVPQSATQQGGWIDELQLLSYFGNGGLSEHEVQFRVVNAGLADLRLVFDREIADLRSIDDAGREQRLSTAARAGEFRVPLPAGVCQANLRLRYTAAGSERDSWFHRLTAPVPKPSLPTLAGRWTLALPPEFAPAERRRFTARAGAPDSAAASDFSGDDSFAAWQLYDAELPSAPVATIDVYRPHLLTAWSQCLAVAAAAIAILMRLRAAWLAPAALLCCAGALVAPPPLVGPLLALGAGLLLAGIWSLVRPLTERNSPLVQHAAALSSQLGHVAPVIGLALLLASPAAAILAAPGDPPSAAAAKPRPRVIFPVDEELLPAGDYVYLEPEFYETLHRLTDSRPAALAPCLLERASYTFPVAAREDAAAAVLDEVQAVFEFHTLAPSAVLRLPLSRQQIVLREGQARLNGRPVKLSWDPNGDALTLAIESAGQHRLELALGAVGRQTPQGLVFALQQPRAAQTSVSLPDGQGELIAPPAAASEANALDPLSLPASDELTVRWPGASGAASGGGVRGDQLLWWKVRPGSVVLEGLFRLQPAGGEFREVTIAIDSRLRLLPGALPAGRITTKEDGARQLVTIQFPEPVAAPTQLRLSWLWPEVSGLGNLLLPVVRVQAAHLDRQWLAISAADGLTAERPAASQTVAAAEFVAAWEEVASPPSIVLVDEAATATMPISVRPEVRLPRTAQTLDWSCGGTSATAQLVIRLQQTPKTRLEHRLTMPPQVKVTRAQIFQGGHEAATRWQQNPDGSLLMTLLEPADAEQELVVTAELQTPRQRPRLPLPDIRLEDAALDSAIMRIYRQSDVAVRLQFPAGWSEQDDEGKGTYREGFGRLVVALRSAGAIGNTQPVVARQTNRPKIAGHALIRATEADGDWRGELDLDLDITQGVLDELRLEIPDSWAGPLLLEPPLEQRVEDLPGQRQRLIVRPPQAAQGRWQLTIRGPLASGDGVAAPDVILLDAPAVERLVLLDRGRAGQPIDWETTGLIAVAQSAQEVPERWRGLEGEMLRAVAARFDATARPRQESSAASEVHLAEVSLQLAADGKAAGIARYLVRPGGAQNLQWSLPADCRLIQTLVDGVAVTSTGGPRSWSFATPSTTLPFELTIAFDGTLPTDPDLPAGRRLAAPRLMGVRQPQTVWQVTAFHSDWTLSSSATVANDEQIAYQRLNAAAQAVEDCAAAAGAGNVLASVLSASANHWLRRYDEALSAHLRITPHDANEADERAASRQAAADRVARAQKRLTALGIRPAEGLADVEMNVADSDAAQPSSRSASSRGVRVISSDPDQVLAVSWRDPAAERAGLAGICAVLLAGLAVAVGIILRLRPRSDWFTDRGRTSLASPLAPPPA